MPEEKDKNIVTSDDLAQVEPFAFPETPKENVYDISAIPTTDQVQGVTADVTQTEQEGADISTRIEDLLGQISGKAAATATAEKEAGLPEYQKQLTDINAQLQTLQKESAAIPMEMQEQFGGRGVTAQGLQPVTTSALRRNAIKALGLSAIGQTLQGNISLAQQNVSSAIEAEFGQAETELKYQRELYDMNQDRLVRVDKKRTELLNVQLAERERVLEGQKAEREELYQIGLTASKYGADSQTLLDIFNAQSREEATLLAGKFLQDPMTKLKLEQTGLSIEQARESFKYEMNSLALGNELKRMQITKTQREIEIFNKYGGLSPIEYNKQIKNEAKELRESQEDIDQSKEDGILLNNSISQINAILNSSALNSVVGPSVFARGAGRQKGWMGSTIMNVYGALSLGTGAGVIDEITGKADDTVALTQQMLDQQFLDKLIAVKSKGATFGALSDNEGAALRNAANAIASTAIKKDERVIAFDMSEKEFRKQMKIIQDTMFRAYQKATKESFSPDEQAVFDEIGMTLQETSFNPAY